MRRWAALVLAAAMTLALLTGCGAKTEAKTHACAGKEFTEETTCSSFFLFPSLIVNRRCGLGCCRR